MPLFFLLVGAVVGYGISQSRGQEQVQAIQKEMMRLAAVIEQRDRQVAQLLATQAQLQRDIATVQRQLAASLKFAEWMVGAHPEILKRYQVLHQLGAHVGLLQLEGATDRRRLSELRQQLQ